MCIVQYYHESYKSVPENCFSWNFMQLNAAGGWIKGLLAAKFHRDIVLLHLSNKERRISLNVDEISSFILLGWAHKATLALRPFLSIVRPHLISNHS
jgi:hypothetical protein